MNCADFDAKIDLYIDGLLSDSEMTAASDHTHTCGGCSEIVAGYQQARALLKTAVTDRVAAVDVSGMWARIEASLENGVQTGRAAGFRPWALPATIRGWAQDLRERTAAVAAGLTPLRAGTWAAAAAIAALLITVSDQEPVQVATQATQKLEGKPVRIDSMEVAAGHTVSTWVRPRTRTRVIWVGENDGFSVTSASHSR